MIEAYFHGSMGNNIIQNIGLSIIAEKLNLKIKNYKISIMKRIQNGKVDCDSNRS